MRSNLDWRWIFIFGLLTGAVLADVTYPAPEPAFACITDTECEVECLLMLPDGQSVEECEVRL